MVTSCQLLYCMELGRMTKLPKSDLSHRGCYMSVVTKLIDFQLQWKYHCDIMYFSTMYKLNTDLTRSGIGNSDKIFLMHLFQTQQ